MARTATAERPFTEAESVLALQRSAGNRAVETALAVQRDGPTGLGMRPPVTVVPGGGGGLFGPAAPPDLAMNHAFIQQLLADEEARRPRLTFDVYTRGMNPQLYAAMHVRSPTDHSPTSRPGPTAGSTSAQGGAGAGAEHEDDNKPHFEVHAQLQAGQAANAQFNQAAVGPGARAAQTAAPGTQTSTQTQIVAGVVLQFHDDAHWGIELTPIQAQLNLDSNGHVTGWQGNAQLAIVSAAMDTIFTGDDGQAWKAQLQGFVQGSAGQNFDPPDAAGSSQSHPTGSLQVGAQAALVHGPIQLWLQVTGGAGATTSPGANPQFFMAPTVSAAAGITIQF